MRWSAAWLYGVLMGSALVVGGVVWYERERLPEPFSSEPLWPRLAAYQLVDGEGHKLSLGALHGRVVLLAFIYTRCPSVCPRLSGVLRQLLTEFAPSDPVAALSISLAPEQDTGAALTAYAQAYEVPGHTWWYARPESQPHAFLIAREVFGLTAAKLPGSEEILHNDAFFLVSCNGQVYGPYTSRDFEKAKKDLQKLIGLCERSSSG